MFEVGKKYINQRYSGVYFCEHNISTGDSVLVQKDKAILSKWDERWTEYKEPRSANSRYVAVHQTGKGNLYIGTQTYPEKNCFNNIAGVVDIIEIKYTEKT